MKGNEKFTALQARLEWLEKTQPLTMTVTVNRINGLVGTVSNIGAGDGAREKVEADVAQAIGALELVLRELRGVQLRLAAEQRHAPQQ